MSDGMDPRQYRDMDYYTSDTTSDMVSAVPHLDRACELLWQAGHPAIAEALQSEVTVLIEKAFLLERILRPRVAEEER